MTDGILRRHRDVALLGAALVLTALFVAIVATPGTLVGPILVAAVFWWGGNTVSHNHLHNPIFRSPLANRAFSLYLTLVLGVPQQIWKRYHFRHHGLRIPPLGALGGIELLALATFWLALAAWAPRFFVAAYLPGLGLGLVLCHAQGVFEHATPAGVSHYGRLWNRLWFNDGFHAEHHAHPGAHWTELPSLRGGSVAESPWPPVLRWIDNLGRALNRLQAHALARLERRALAWPRLLDWSLRRHERAFRRILAALGARRLDEVAVVGGGLHPRTAIVLRRLLPGCRIVAFEPEPEHAAIAQACLAADGAAPVEIRDVEWTPAHGRGFDLVVIPLGFRGDRGRLYVDPPPGAALVIHDWIWRSRGHATAVVSPFLLKRLNLVV